MHFKNFHNFLNENAENVEVSETLLNSCFSNFTNTPIKLKLDEKGRVILRAETVRVNTDNAGYTQLPFVISPKSRKDITFRFDKATKLTTLFGFPPLPEANFLIWNDVTTSIPKSERDIVLSHQTTKNAVIGGEDFGWHLTDIGIEWLESGLPWEKYAAGSKVRSIRYGLR